MFNGKILLKIVSFFTFKLTGCANMLTGDFLGEPEQLYPAAVPDYSADITVLVLFTVGFTVQSQAVQLFGLLGGVSSLLVRHLHILRLRARLFRLLGFRVPVPCSGFVPPFGRCFLHDERKTKRSAEIRTQMFLQK